MLGRFFSFLKRPKLSALIISDGSHRVQQAVWVCEQLNANVNIIEHEQIERSYTGNLLKHKPDIVLAVGSAPARVVKKIKAQWPAVFTINILDPMSCYNLFDALVVPSHEPEPDHKHVIKTIGLINKMNSQDVSEVHTSGHIAVLIGGTHIDGDVLAEDVLEMIQSLQEQGHILYITSSKRSSKKLVKMLGEEVKDPHQYYAMGMENNPYEEWLKTAQSIVVTGDSARMVSESCSVGKPVCIFLPKTVNHHYQAIAKEMVHNGVATSAKRPEEITWKTPAKTLNEAYRVAGELHMLINSQKKRKDAGPMGYE